jgi:hypothetical protein
MIGKSLFASAAVALMLTSAAAAQTPGGANAAPPTPTDQATQPVGSTTQDGRPYSDSGSGLPADPSDMPRMNGSSNAAQHGSDSAAQTPSDADAAQIQQCKAMPNDQMMRNATCAALARKHPTMMNGGAPDPQ